MVVFGLVLLAVCIMYDNFIESRKKQVLMEPEIEAIKTLRGRVWWRGGTALWVYFNNMDVNNMDVTAAHVKALTDLQTMQQRLGFAFSLDVDFTSSRLTDRKLSFIGDLPTISRLYLNGSNIEVDALCEVAQCSNCSNLSSLHVAGTTIGDVSLESIVDLPNLYILSLDGTGITDSGLAALRNTPNLTFLSLGNTQISDTGVALLLKENLLKLEYLDLKNWYC